MNTIDGSSDVSNENDWLIVRKGRALYILVILAANSGRIIETDFVLLV
jgi:hypothetical protein